MGTYVERATEHEHEWAVEGAFGTLDVRVLYRSVLGDTEWGLVVSHRGTGARVSVDLETVHAFAFSPDGGRLFHQRVDRLFDRGPALRVARVFETSTGREIDAAPQPARRIDAVFLADLFEAQPCPTWSDSREVWIDDAREPAFVLEAEQPRPRSNDEREAAMATWLGIVGRFRPTLTRSVFDTREREAWLDLLALFRDWPEPGRSAAIARATPTLETVLARVRRNPRWLPWTDPNPVWQLLGEVQLAPRGRDGEPLGDVGVERLVGSGHIEFVNVLDLADSGLTDAAVASLVRWRAFRDVRALDLSRNRLTDASARALVRCPGLRGIQELGLHGNRISAVGAREMLAPGSFRELRALSLRENLVTRAEVADRLVERAVRVSL